MNYNAYPQTIITPDVQRGDLIRARALMRDPNGDMFIVQPQTLRVHKQLIAGKNSYTFDFYETPNSDHPLDIKLNRNDAFFASHIGVWVKRRGNSEATRNDGSYPYFTFPDPNYFLGANAGANLPEWQALYCVYNGTITLKTKPTERLIKFAATNCLYVPERTWQGTAATSQAAVEQPQWGADQEKRGLYHLPELVILGGNEDNTAEITLATGDTTNIGGTLLANNTASNQVNDVALVLHGFNVIRGAEQVYQWLGR